MNDDELIGYCDLHSTTPRALFNGEQINRMIELAGNPDGYEKVNPDSWLSAHESMQELCKRARQRQKIRIVK